MTEAGIAWAKGGMLLPALPASGPFVHFAFDLAPLASSPPPPVSWFLQVQPSSCSLLGSQNQVGLFESEIYQVL